MLRDSGRALGPALGATMADDEGQVLGAEWAAAVGAVEEEVRAWRRGHPRATLTELEQMTEAATRRLQRQLLEDVAQGLAAATDEGRPACPHCGRSMLRRGRKVQEVLVAHQPQPVRLERASFVCPAGGAGLSPLDEALGLVPGSLSPQLLEGVVRLGSSMPFARAAEDLAFFWGVWLSEDTVRRHTEGAGAALAAAEDAEVARLQLRRRCLHRHLNLRQRRHRVCPLPRPHLLAHRLTRLGSIGPLRSLRYRRAPRAGLLTIPTSLLPPFVPSQPPTPLQRSPSNRRRRTLWRTQSLAVPHFVSQPGWSESAAS